MRRMLEQGAPGHSPLDHAVDGFRHRWETDPQYRMRIGTIAGGSAVVFLCLVAAIASVAANLFFGGGSLASGGTLSGSNGPGGAFGIPTFPTGTVSPWTPGTVPNAPPLPNSQTPPPSATRQPTPTGGGGGFATPTPGGTMPTTCNGSKGSATWALTPCPQVAGQGGTLAISAPGHGGASLNIILSFGVCANNQNCTLLFTPDQGYHLDGSGAATITYTVPAAAANNTAPISGMIQVSGGPTMSILAAPVK